MNALPCPFCGAEAVPKWDAPESKPYYVRCSQPTCPGHNSTVTHAEADVAMDRWNRRAQMPPANPFSIACIGGFTTKSLIRGELVYFDLDRTGVLRSDSFRFNPHSQALMLKPRE